MNPISIPTLTIPSRLTTVGEVINARMPADDRDRTWLLVTGGIIAGLFLASIFRR